MKVLQCLIPPDRLMFPWLTCRRACGALRTPQPIVSSGTPPHGPSRCEAERWALGGAKEVVRSFSLVPTDRCEGHRHTLAPRQATGRRAGQTEQVEEVRPRRDGWCVRHAGNAQPEPPSLRRWKWWSLGPGGRRSQGSAHKSRAVSTGRSPRAVSAGWPSHNPEKENSMVKEKSTSGEGTSRQQSLAKAQRHADKALRAAHADEWNSHMKAAAAEQGIADWQPPVSAEEKAKAKIEALLAEHPGLAASYPSAARPESA